jgi:hypothetical protein
VLSAVASDSSIDIVLVITSVELPKLSGIRVPVESEEDVESELVETEVDIAVAYSVVLTPLMTEV